MRLFAASILLVSATAFADQPAPPKAEPVSAATSDCAKARAQHKDCVIDMSGEELEGNQPVATDAMISFVKWTKQQSLITLRRDFIPEIVKTAEDL